ncbi:MAG: cellulase family glycosylhydrolase [Ruminococcus sp.]|nr:cellulase family glycosylhydrolase [Ruminococcus sp.]
MSEEKLNEDKEQQAPAQDNKEQPPADDTPVKQENGGENKSAKKFIIACVAVNAVVIIALVIVLVVLFGGKKENKPKTAKVDSAAAVVVDVEEPEREVPAETEKPEETEAPAETEKPEDKQEDEAGDGFIFTYSAGNGWEDNGKQMCTMEMGITNKSGSAVSGWKLELEVEGLKSCEGWNGNFTVSGNTLTITNVDYNGDIPAGGSVNPGCNIGTTGALNITSAKLNGTECTIKKGSVPQQNNNNNNGNNNNNNNNGSNGSAVDVSALLKRSDKAKQGDDWLHTDGNKILDKDGKQVWITGVNWFGYNTGTNTFDGLWNSELEPSVKAIADHGFNLIRVPISAELINQWAAGEYPKANYNNAYNPELNAMNSLEIFDYFLKLAEQNGLKVMPDIHSAETDASGHNVNLWYTDRISVEKYYAALEWMADRYKDNDTIIAFDLKNEPHGKPYEGDKAAIWNNSKSSNNWKYVAETAAAKVLAKNPNVLIMVEGTEIYPKNIKTNGDFKSTNDDDYYFNWWGGNLRGVKDYPIDLGKYQDKLVYSPHDYGPTVYEQPWFKGDYSYESLKKDCWNDNWLYIHTGNTAPLLIGEWGGFMRDPNLKWMTYMRQLITTYHLNHTFWCFNANSGDTGGLVLDDFVTWDEEKYNFVKEALWQEGGKFVGLDHAIALGQNGITLKSAKGL